MRRRGISCFLARVIRSSLLDPIFRVLQTRGFPVFDIDQVRELSSNVARALPPQLCFYHPRIQIEEIHIYFITHSRATVILFVTPDGTQNQELPDETTITETALIFKSPCDFSYLHLRQQLNVPRLHFV